MRHGRSTLVPSQAAVAKQDSPTGRHFAELDRHYAERVRPETDITTRRWTAAWPTLLEVNTVFVNIPDMIPV